MHCQALDMMDLKSVAAVRQELPERFRQIDILLNNAGLALGTAGGHEVDMGVRCCSLLGFTCTRHLPDLPEVHSRLQNSRTFRKPAGAGLR